MIDQKQLLEDVKKLLQGLDHFFSVTLKKEKLKKDTITEKDQLYGQLKEALVQLVGEEPQEEYDDASSYMPAQPEVEGEDPDSGMLYDETVVEPTKPLPPLDNISHTGSQKSEIDDDNDEDKGDLNYEGTRIRPKSVTELGQTSKEGILEKKRKDGQFGFSQWQTRFCIIKDNMLYYYKSKTDSKQCNEISLSGYEASSAPDIEKKHKKRQFLFLVSQPGCRSFQFMAQSQEDMKSWMDAINAASKLMPKAPPAVTSGSDSVSMASGEADDFGEQYEDLDDYQKFKLEDKKVTEVPADFGEEYEDLDEYQKFKIGQGVTSPPKDVPTFEPVQEENDFGDEYEDLDDYQKMKMGGPKVQEASADFGETYDDVTVPVDSVRNTPLPPPPPPVGAFKLPARDRPLPPRELPQPRNLPIPPTIKEDKSNEVNINEPWKDDFRNIYVGLWDCKADEENELEFKRGDFIHILSQEYSGWWVGEKNYMVGLVPEKYLMKAYVS